MKKLMLTALLAIGATSFSAIEGTQTDVSLPIKVTGEVVAASANLMIEATTSGMTGDEMKFNFGSLVDNGKASAPMEGTFRVFRADGSALKGSGNATTVKAGFDEGVTQASATSTLTRGTGAVTINYAVGIATPNMDGKEVNGTVSVSASVTSGATPGVFTDTSQKIYVKFSGGSY